MNTASVNPSRHGLDQLGLQNRAAQFWNLRPPALVVEALRRGEATLSDRGALVAVTKPRTGRSPKDKFIVRDAGSEKHVHWGDLNVAMDAAKFDRLQAKVLAHLAERDVFVQDLYAGADPANRLKVRFVNQFAWHNLFVRQLFVRPKAAETSDFIPDFTVLGAPTCTADTAADGTNSDAFIVVNFAKKLVLVAGTRYAGELKKSIFTILNYLLPLRQIMSMHCSANVGASGDVALFFGLSGTGKTTLSADPNRALIGDDEHGWSETGVFNFEGGCYAKCINLSEKYEPQIYHAVRFGSVLENVVLDPVTAAPKYEDASLTENTRCAYPLSHIENAVEPSVGTHPKNIIFLTCDAFGVLPPVARLTTEQAMYHFLSGYTAKVAGTEAGVTEPQATFSTCFGAPFMVHDPSVYADLLGKKISQHKTRVWLINTGWTGGPYGVGSRFSLPYTRAIITAALSGALDEVAYENHPVFGVAMPKSCPGVPPEVLNPRGTWKDSAAYDARAKDLSARFMKNFAQFASASAAIKAAGPKG